MTTTVRPTPRQAQVLRAAAAHTSGYLVGAGSVVRANLVERGWAAPQRYSRTLRNGRTIDAFAYVITDAGRAVVDALPSRPEPTAAPAPPPVPDRSPPPTPRLTTPTVHLFDPDGTISWEQISATRMPGMMLAVHIDRADAVECASFDRSGRRGQVWAFPRGECGCP